MCAAFIPCWFVLIEFELGDCSVSVRTNYIFPPYNSRPHKPKAQFYQAVKFSRGKIDNKFLRWRRGMILSNQKMMASLLQPLFSELKRCVSSIWASFSSSPSRPWSVKSGGRTGGGRSDPSPKKCKYIVLACCFIMAIQINLQSVSSCVPENHTKTSVNKRPIKVCVSCSWRRPGSHIHPAVYLPDGVHESL